jgi:dTDP-4-amino-4,6-dideoxygalactose transaminase
LIFCRGAACEVSLTATLYLLGIVEERTLSGVPCLDLTRANASSRAALVDAFVRTLDSGRYVLGPELERFEAEFAAYCGTKYAIGVGNGLDALYLILRAMGIGPGDEVLVPAHTFVATWLAVTRCGATPVPVEPDPQTCLVTSAGFEARLTSRTRAVIAAHLYGSLHGIHEIAALCRARGVPLIEDAAQAHGARASSQRAGSFGVAASFSFFPTKNLGCLGDGGMVVTNSAELADAVSLLRNYGSRSRYQHEVLGVNSRLDEMQAALLRARLPALDADNGRRTELATLYLKRLSSIDELGLPHTAEPESHVWHLFVVRSRLRDDLQRFLAGRGIESLVHYPHPVYRLTPYVGFAPEGESVADRIAASVLSLPMGLHLRDEDVHSVCDAIADFFHHRP